MLGLWTALTILKIEEPCFRLDRLDRFWPYMVENDQIQHPFLAKFEPFFFHTYSFI